MNRSAVVTCFLRHRGNVLLLRRAAAASTYPGRWAGVSGYVEGGDPDATARREIREETGLSDPALVRRGRPFAIRDDAADREWGVHPFLFDVDTRTVTLNEESAEASWLPATAILRRHTVPALAISYAHVAPSVTTVEEDTTRGSSALSITALEVLRDAAGWAAATDDGYPWVTATATDLVTARPSMAVLRNRVNRAMAGVRTADAVERAAIQGIDRAYSVDEGAADEAAAALGGQVLTLSRSGTVEGALRRAVPAVYVAESRPDGEGVDVAESLAETGLDVTICTDAAIAQLLADAAIDSVVVGADTILADGTVVNKTGTRMAALAAHHEDVPFIVASATDKVSHEPAIHRESGAPESLYAGTADLTVSNPIFDVTPPELIDTIVTERGQLHPNDIAALAEEMAGLAHWQEQE